MVKLNLIYFDDDILSGYINIHPWAMSEQEDPIVRIGNLFNLGIFVDDSEANEIIANKVVDYLSPQEFDQAIGEWIKKLRHGGQLTIIGTDLYMVLKDAISFKISAKKANKLIFGQQSQEFILKRQLLNCRGVALLLEKEFGLEILEQKYDGYNFIVTGRRK